MSENNTKISFDDVHGLSQLVQTAILQLTDVAEEVQLQAVQPPFLPVTPVQRIITGISSGLFHNVRQATRLIGGGIGMGLQRLPKRVSLGSSKHRATLKAILNGIIGDHLAAEKNPLAQEMEFTCRGRSLELTPGEILNHYPTANGKILLFLHGSCMNDLLWKQNGHNHSQLLEEESNYTVVHLRYNTGLHISSNGQQFNHLLEQLVQNWPVPVKEISIIAHSMGGLLTRSAMYYTQQNNYSWFSYLQKVIFIGTPHNGAPLERIGNYVDQLLMSVPYLRPFARVGKLRSAGITDLRYASLVEEDWRGFDRFSDAYKNTKFIPLPEGITAYAIAGSLQGKARLLGDGLVLKPSALGHATAASRSLYFHPDHTFVAENTGHINLLGSRAVYDKIKTWLLES